MCERRLLVVLTRAHPVDQLAATVDNRGTDHTASNRALQGVRECGRPTHRIQLSQTERITERAKLNGHSCEGVRRAVLLAQPQEQADVRSLASRNSSSSSAGWLP